MRPLLVFFASLVVLSSTLLPSPAAARSAESYIVILSDTTDAARFARDAGARHGFAARHVYTAALRGFAATLPSQAVEALSRNPAVVAIERETVQSVAADEVPTGVDRIDTERLIPVGSSDGLVVNADIAIIDTGVQRHADLNVAGGFSATSRKHDGWLDENGHGTHVAGTVAALDNGSGVVGVAPGARVWGVRVCKTGNMCLTGDMVAGIDWVAQRKREATDGPDGDPGINFVSANMSLTSSDEATPCPTRDAVHRAICGLVSSGVVFVQAAANDNRVKNAYPEAVSVSALADFDGKPGGLGASTCRADEDDTRADFSNYGPTTDMAAPGVCIKSTWKGGGYAVLSGTSMAAPHVTGAFALYLHRNPSVPIPTNAAGVDGLRAALADAALPQGDPSGCSFVSDKAGVGSTEPLLFVNDTQHFHSTDPSCPEPPAE